MESHEIMGAFHLCPFEVHELWICLPFLTALRFEQHRSVSDLHPLERVSISSQKCSAQALQRCIVKETLDNSIDNSQSSVN